MNSKIFKSFMLIVLFTFSLFVISCEHNTKQTGSASFSVPGRVMNILAARAGEELSELSLSVTLCKADDTEIETKTLADWTRDEKRTAIFDKLDTGLKVYAKASVSAGDKKLYEGKSETKTVDLEGITLSLVLKAVKNSDDPDFPDVPDIPDADALFSAQITYIFQDDLGNKKSSEIALTETKEFNSETTKDDILSYIDELKLIISKEDYTDYNLDMLRIIYADEDVDWLTLEEDKTDSLISSILSKGLTNNSDFSIDVYLKDKSLTADGSISLDPSLAGLTISYDTTSAKAFRNCINILFSVTPPRTLV